MWRPWVWDSLLSLRTLEGLRNYPKKDDLDKIIESNQEAAQAITNYMTSASNFNVDEASQFIQQFTITKQIEQVEKLLEE